MDGLDLSIGEDDEALPEVDDEFLGKVGWEEFSLKAEVVLEAPDIVVLHLFVFHCVFGLHDLEIWRPVGYVIGQSINPLDYLFFPRTPISEDP